MGYVENGEERLQHLDNLLKKEETPEVSHETCGGGRREGDKEIPDFLRGLIGITAKVSGPTKAARAFGVSQPVASSAKQGKRSQNGPVDEELKETIDGTIAKARSKAVDAVMAALDILPAKIDDSMKAKDLAAIAKDVSVVVDKLAPAEEKAQRGSQVIFYMPKEKEITDYPVIDVTPVEAE